jgi:hypothetical protein
MPDGAPHVMPVWIRREGSNLLFFKEEGSLGLRNAERDGRVAISIVDRSDPYRMAYVRGRVSEIRRGAIARRWLDDAAVHYMGRPYPHDITGAIVVVAPDRTGSAHYREFGTED